MSRVLVVLVVILGALGVVISMQPDTYHVERSATINAPADVVYAQVSDFNKMGAWSPWDKLDPNMKKEITGEPGTVGHKSSWSGNKDVGTGSQTITKADPGQGVSMELNFKEPFESIAMAGFTLEPEGQATKVTWWMDGKNDFMGKAFSLFMDMDKMVGNDYEKGLAALAPIAEAEAKAKAAEEAAKKAAEEAAAAAEGTEGEAAE